MKLKIQKLTNDYVKEVAKLESDLISPVSEELIKKTIDSDVNFYFVLINENDELIGFLQGQIISPEAELFEIGIDKKFQGNGYSKLLIEHFFNFVKEKKCDTIFLEVNSINIKAQNLYKKYGFCEYGKREKYYGENDAILMKLKI